MQFVLPKAPTDLLQHQIARGSAGIDEVIKSLCQVNSREAKAWKMEDEIKVKLQLSLRQHFRFLKKEFADFVDSSVSGFKVLKTC